MINQLSHWQFGSSDKMLEFLGCWDSHDTYLENGGYLYRPGKAILLPTRKDSIYVYTHLPFLDLFKSYEYWTKDTYLESYTYYRFKNWRYRELIMETTGENKYQEFVTINLDGSVTLKIKNKYFQSHRYSEGYNGTSHIYLHDSRGYYLILNKSHMYPGMRIFTLGFTNPDVSGITFQDIRLDGSEASTLKIIDNGKVMISHLRERISELQLKLQNPDDKNLEIASGDPTMELIKVSSTEFKIRFKVPVSAGVIPLRIK